MRHKHADLIHAWAEGAEIQIYSSERGEWEDIPIPSFIENLRYRIKPEKKPDVVMYVTADLQSTKFVCVDRVGPVCVRHSSNNLKLEFDGETGKLIKAEVLS